MKARLQQLLLICGILAPALYIGTDIVAANLLFPGYSYTAKQVSELSAIGSPTRALWNVMGLIYMLLLVAFGIGVLRSGKKVSLRITGILILASALIGLLWAFAPMHQRGTVSVSVDIWHIVFAALQVLTLVLIMSFGAAAMGKNFRIYSVLNILLMLAFGAYTGTAVSAIAAGQPTPWMGLVERVSVYSPMVWLIVFAIVLQKTDSQGLNA
jgi:hypothetical protein